MSNWNRHKTTCPTVVKPSDLIIQSKDDQIDFLKSQCEQKDQQIHEKDRQIKLLSGQIRLLLKGNRPKSNRARRTRILQRFNHQCAVEGCNLTLHTNGPNFFELDHILPLADGGSDEDDNLQVLCLNHHREKTLLENQRRSAD